MEPHGTGKMKDPEAEAPEDVTTLSPLAKLQEVKYRDLSASRREYRAQLRHRATEQIRDEMLPSQGEADSAARQAHESVREEEVAHAAAVERVESARRAEAAAVAAAVARREEREVAEAQVLAQAQAARYVDSEEHRGELVDPRELLQRREHDAPHHEDIGVGSTNQTPTRIRPVLIPTVPLAGSPVASQEVKILSEENSYSQQSSAASDTSQQQTVRAKRHDDPQPQIWMRQASSQDSMADSSSASLSEQRETVTERATSPSASRSIRAGSPFSQAPSPSSVRGCRAQDDFGYWPASAYSDSSRPVAPESLPEMSSSSQRAPYTADPTGPAWLYAPPISQQQPKPRVSPVPPPQASVAETLQHSRERVAARWFALKGVFEHPGQEPSEAAPVRQKETRTPVLAVFSLAGGVGKTSLVATVGRSLSSLGEKVLLTDTTSHGLLPFYFGASELRQGIVRTFSPPSGSTDAPIYLVNYEIDQKIGDEAAQELLVEEILNSSRGTHRIMLDLTASSVWVVRLMARMNPTILVPVAPDMNSVISLQAVERFFHGVIDGDGRPVQPYYLLNQFDASLPLHLDVREVLRRQLGDRLLPFVIRRAPAVSEALAEGMTVVDYAPESSISEDYLNVATWLRTIAAPATAGFRNVRWSER